MKKFTYTLLGLAITFNMFSQAVLDSVQIGSTNEIWYSLQNDEQGTQAYNNWDIGFAASSSQNGALTTSILFNARMGSLYAIPSSSPSNFHNADTTGITTWSSLYNSDTSWAKGAFNRTPSLGAYDYGFGSYNASSHNVEANRVFVVKYSNNTYRKLMITLNSVAGTYTLIHNTLDNTDSTNVTINIPTYSTKNFVYYNMPTKAIIDREPAASTWDLFFTKYYTPIPSMYLVTGVLHNQGVKSSMVNTTSVSTYIDYNAHPFKIAINTVGYDWKVFNNSTFTYSMRPDTLFFVKTQANDIWKIIFTGYGSGKFKFTKEKLATVTTPTTTPTGIEPQSESTNALLSIYPNPSSEGNTTIIYDFENAVSSAVLSIYNLTGASIYSEKLNNSTGLHTHNLNTSLFNSGIYFLTIEFDGKKLQQKLIIQ